MGCHCLFTYQWDNNGGQNLSSLFYLLSLPLPPTKHSKFFQITHLCRCLFGPFKSNVTVLTVWKPSSACSLILRVILSRGRWDKSWSILTHEDSPVSAEALKHCVMRAELNTWHTQWETDDLLQITEQHTYCSLIFLSTPLSPSANHWCHSTPWNATPLWFSPPPSSLFLDSLFFSQPQAFPGHSWSIPFRWD